MLSAPQKAAMRWTDTKGLGRKAGWCCAPFARSQKPLRPPTPTHPPNPRQALHPRTCAFALRAAPIGPTLSTSACGSQASCS